MENNEKEGVSFGCDRFYAIRQEFFSRINLQKNKMLIDSLIQSQSSKNKEPTYMRIMNYTN